MTGTFSRRGLLAGAGALLAMPAILRADEHVRLGLTPVFLDNDGAVLARLRAALEQATGRPVELVQRRTYQEVTGLVLEGGVTAAWLCGYPYLQHEASLSLLGVPIWRGAPLYRSYLIVEASDPATSIDDLTGSTHAFSDPDSNSGWLVTASDLARRGLKPDGFFSRTLFTYGHRNVVRAVASGLARSGSVDGYVWEALTAVEPALTALTRVVSQSELLGFPPFVARRDLASNDMVLGLQRALLSLEKTSDGKAALGMMQLDRIAAAETDLFDGIRVRMAELRPA